MIELHWTQAAQPLDCPQCEYLAGDHNQLQKASSLSPVSDGLAILDYSCKICGYRARFKMRVPIEDSADSAAAGSIRLPDDSETSAIKSETERHKRSGLVSSKKEAVTLEELYDLCDKHFASDAEVLGFPLFRKLKKQPGVDQWSNGAVVGHDPDSVRVSYHIRMSGNKESEICHALLVGTDGEPDFEKVSSQLMRDAQAIVKGPAKDIRVIIPKPSQGARIICPKCSHPRETCACAEMQPFLKDVRLSDGVQVAAAPGPPESSPFSGFLTNKKPIVGVLGER